MEQTTIPQNTADRISTCADAVAFGLVLHFWTPEIAEEMQTAASMLPAVSGLVRGDLIVYSCDDAGVDQ